MDDGREARQDISAGGGTKGNRLQPSPTMTLSSSNKSVVWAHKDVDVSWPLTNKLGLLLSPCRLGVSLLPLLVDEEVTVVMSLKVFGLGLRPSWSEGSPFNV